MTEDCRLQQHGGGLGTEAPQKLHGAVFPSQYFLQEAGWPDESLGPRNQMCNQSGKAEA